MFSSKKEKQAISIEDASYSTANHYLLISLWASLLLVLLIISLISFTSEALGQIFDSDYTSDESMISGSISIGLTSDRTFRGRNLYDGTSIQPAAELSVGTSQMKGYVKIFSHIPGEQGTRTLADSSSFSATDSGGNTVNAKTVEKSMSELDTDFGISLDTGVALIEIGNRWYYYTTSTSRFDDTSEAYMRITGNFFLHPHLLTAYDWDKYNGWYYETGVEEELPVFFMNADITITPSITLGFNDGLENDTTRLYTDHGLVFYEFGLEGKLPISNSWSIRPRIHYTEGDDNSANTEFTFGLNLVGEFD